MKMTQSYLMGIREGREIFAVEGARNAAHHFANSKRLCREFSAYSEIGQFHRGERDFWKNKLNR